jgi:hypothetical protein
MRAVLGMTTAPQWERGPEPGPPPAQLASGRAPHQAVDLPERTFGIRSRAVNCAGGLVLHVDWTVAGRTEDDELDGCAGLELPHEGGPKRCFEWYEDGCNRCGIHQT